MKNNIIVQLLELLKNIDQESIDLYYKNIEKLTEYVNAKMEDRSDIDSLIGGHDIDLMRANHTNHANFMYNIFQTKDAVITYETYLWVYNTYSKKGFLYGYFYYELINWKKSLEEIDSKKFSSIIKLYEYLITIHKHFEEHSINFESPVPSNKKEKTYNRFMNALLTSNLELAMSISHEFIQTDDDIKVFWEEIILIALYEVGSKWENAQISVGEEHTATSICQRVMAEHYSKIISHVNMKRKVLVTTSPNELHEVGARMLADILELNGYNVYYLSSKTNIIEVNETINFEAIEYVVISSTLYSNITKTKEMVEDIRKNCRHKNLKIILGGQAYNKVKVGSFNSMADYCMTDIDELLNLLKENL